MGLSSQRPPSFSFQLAALGGAAAFALAAVLALAALIARLAAALPFTGVLALAGVRALFPHRLKGNPAGVGSPAAKGHRVRNSKAKTNLSPHCHDVKYLLAGREWPATMSRGC